MFFLFPHTCGILAWGTEGQLEQTTWSARVHKEISEDYFCNFRVNALFIILWIAEAKSGKDLRSLAEISLALRRGGGEIRRRGNGDSRSAIWTYPCVTSASLSASSFIALSLCIRLPTIISQRGAFLYSLCVNYHLAALHALHGCIGNCMALRGDFLQMWLPFQWCEIGTSDCEIVWSRVNRPRTNSFFIRASASDKQLTLKIKVHTKLCFRTNITPNNIQLLRDSKATVCEFMTQHTILFLYNEIERVACLCFFSHLALNALRWLKWH